MFQNLSLEVRVIPDVRHDSGTLLQPTMCTFPNERDDHLHASATSGHPKDKHVEQLDRVKIKKVTHGPRASKPLAAEIFGHISCHNRDFEEVRAFTFGQDMRSSEPNYSRPEDDNMSL